MIREIIKSQALKLFAKDDGTINVSELTRQTGIQKTQLGQFLKGKTTLGTGNADKLLKVLKIRLVAIK